MPKVGKDIGFMTAFYPADTQVVAPYPLEETLVYRDTHPTFTISLGNASCKQKYGENSKMANIEELKSVFVNNNLGYINSGQKFFLTADKYASSSVTLNSNAYYFHAYTGSVNQDLISYSGGTKNRIFCVKKINLIRF